MRMGLVVGLEVLQRVHPALILQAPSKVDG